MDLWPRLSWISHTGSLLYYSCVSHPGSSNNRNFIRTAGAPCQPHATILRVYYDFKGTLQGKRNGKIGDGRLEQVKGLSAKFSAPSFRLVDNGVKVWVSNPLTPTREVLCWDRFELKTRKRCYKFIGLVSVCLFSLGSFTLLSTGIRGKPALKTNCSLSGSIGSPENSSSLWSACQYCHRHHDTDAMPGSLIFTFTHLKRAHSTPSLWVESVQKQRLIKARSSTVEEIFFGPLMNSEGKVLTQSWKMHSSIKLEFVY